MKISIITPSFNRASTITDTMNSVLRQSYTDYEHIIVDGASRDNTLEMIKIYESQYQGKLKYISEPDNGIYDAINKGIKMATGDVIGILNSDDFYATNDSLKLIANAFNNKEADAVYGDLYFVDPSSLTSPTRYYSGAKFSKSTLKYGLFPPHPTWYCRTEAYRKCGLYKTDYKIAADSEMISRMVYNNNVKCVYIPENLVVMRLGGVSTRNIFTYLINIYEKHRALKHNNIPHSYFTLLRNYLMK